MESTYYGSSDEFIQGQTPTAAEWNHRVFELPQGEFNARWQNFSIWLTAPTVSGSGTAISISNINAIVAGKHFTGSEVVDSSGYTDGSYQLSLDDNGTINIVTSLGGTSLAVASFDLIQQTVSNLSTTDLMARLFIPWVEFVGDDSDEVVVWWVNDGRGGIKRDTNGHMLVSDDGTTWERLAGVVVSPFIEDDSTHSVRRVNEGGSGSPGNTRGSCAVDLVYERSANTQVAAADYSGILSGLNNTVNGLKSVITGGSDNIINATDMTFPAGEVNYGRSFIGSGYHNGMGLNNRLCFIGSGYLNTIDGSDDSYASIIVGGAENRITPDSSHHFYCHTIGGGYQNAINGGNFSTIGGGGANIINTGTPYATIGGGGGNQIAINGQYGCVPGGRSNVAGANSFACGYNAQAGYNGFVFADGTTTTSNQSNQFMVGADGGFYLRNNAGNFDWRYDGAGKWLSTPNGGCCLGSDGVWYSASSREVKHDFQMVNSSDILQKVSETKLEEWRYNATPNAKHIGVMAEDFAENFGLGDNPEGLNPLDVCGVLWAAVQELTKRVAELEEKMEK